MPRPIEVVREPLQTLQLVGQPQRARRDGRDFEGRHERRCYRKGTSAVRGLAFALPPFEPPDPALPHVPRCGSRALAAWFDYGVVTTRNSNASMSAAPELTLTSIVWLPATSGPVAKATRRSWLFTAERSTLVQAPPSTLTSAWPILGPVGAIHASPSPERAVTANEPGVFDRRTLPPKPASSATAFHDPLV